GLGRGDARLAARAVGDGVVDRVRIRGGHARADVGERARRVVVGEAVRGRTGLLDELCPRLGDPTPRRVGGRIARSAAERRGQRVAVDDPLRTAAAGRRRGGVVAGGAVRAVTEVEIGVVPLAGNAGRTVERRAVRGGREAAHLVG